jgi:chromosome segregation ATPase
MEFRDYAAKETSGLLERLLVSQTEASLQHLQTLREALEAASRGVEADAGKQQAEEEIQELVRRLNTAASTAARAASQKVQREMQASLDAVNEELKTQREETERQIAAAAEAQVQADAQAEALRADLKKETERADAADRDLDAAIEAHAQVDAARIEAETALRQQTQAHQSLENDLSELRSLLDQTVADSARQATDLDAARAEIGDLHASVAAARGDAERAQQEARAALDAAKRALTAERDQNEQMANALAEAQAQAEMVRADLTDLQAHMESVQANLARETERADEANRDLDAAIEAHAAVDAARLEAEAATRLQAQARATAEKELAVARAQLEAAMAQAARSTSQVESALAEQRTLAADLSAAQAELEAAHRQREAVAAKLDATRAQLQALERGQGSHDESLQRLESGLNDALQAEASARELAAGAEVEVARAHADISSLRSDVERLGSLIDASSHSIDELASTTSVTDLLASLVRQLSVEFSRVALFRVKGNRLEGEYQIGFDETTDVTKLVLPLNLDSLITRAASSGLVEHLKGSDLDESSRAPFGGTPASALALPVNFQNEAVAVVYADSDHVEGEPHAYDASVGYAKLMVRATAVLMVRLSQELKTLNELREYAGMLLQEAEEMYNADLQSDRSDEERRSRLKDTIECARQLYAQRASLEGAGAGTLLDDRIDMKIEAEPSTQFGRDLAALMGTVERHDSRHTAAS